MQNLSLLLNKHNTVYKQKKGRHVNKSTNWLLIQEKEKKKMLSKQKVYKGGGGLKGVHCAVIGTAHGKRCGEGKWYAGDPT